MSSQADKTELNSLSEDASSTQICEGKEKQRNNHNSHNRHAVKNIEELTQELQNLTKAVEELKDREAKTEKNIEELRRELENSRKTIAELTQLIESFVEPIRRELAESGEGNLRGSHEREKVAHVDNTKRPLFKRIKGIFSTSKSKQKKKKKTHSTGKALDYEEDGDDCFIPRDGPVRRADSSNRGSQFNDENGEDRFTPRYSLVRRADSFNRGSQFNDEDGDDRSIPRDRPVRRADSSNRGSQVNDEDGDDRFIPRDRPVRRADSSNRGSQVNDEDGDDRFIPRDRPVRRADSSNRGSQVNDEDGDDRFIPRDRPVRRADSSNRGSQVNDEDGDDRFIPRDRPVRRADSSNRGSQVNDEDGDDRFIPRDRPVRRADSSNRGSQVNDEDGEDRYSPRYRPVRRAESSNRGSHFNDEDGDERFTPRDRPVRRADSSNRGSQVNVGITYCSRQGSTKSLNVYFDDSEDPDETEGAEGGQRRRYRSSGSLHTDLMRKLSFQKDALDRKPLAGEDPDEVQESLRIVEHPTRQTHKEGSRVVFECKAQGKQNIIYEWRKDGMKIEGEQSCTLVLKDIKVCDFGWYLCEVRCADGQYRPECVESYPAELDVSPSDGMRFKYLDEAFQQSHDTQHNVENLLVKEIPGGGGWKQVASKWKMNEYAIDSLERSHEGGKGVISYLKATYPELTVYEFCKTLKEPNIRRFDIIKKLLVHLVTVPQEQTA